MTRANQQTHAEQIEEKIKMINDAALKLSHDDIFGNKKYLIETLIDALDILNHPDEDEKITALLRTLYIINNESIDYTNENEDECEDEVENQQ